MPTFTAIALDRLLEPGASKSVDKSVPSSIPVSKLESIPPRPVPTSNLDRRKSLPVPERKITRPQISPALYATPEATPLPDSTPHPDSPSSYPPSPYIVNHKRRGPRLLKSYSVDNVASRRKNVDEAKTNGNGKTAENKVVDLTEDRSVTFSVPNSVKERNSNGVHNSYTQENIANGAHEASGEAEDVNGLCDDEIGSSNGDLQNRNLREFSTMNRVVLKPITSSSERESDLDDFFDPQESLGYTSNTDCEDNSVADIPIKLSATTPAGEFYDAWEELSSDSAHQSSLRDVVAESREMRLNLLMEIEKRKQAEETLNNLQSHWQRIKEQLSLVGLTLPAFPSAVQDGVHTFDVDPAEEMCRQVYLARFVSDSIGRGIGKAEAEMEKEAQVQAKNFEIARLLDRLHYYEAVNREMSQRNQEAVEMARRDRQVRKRRQRWVWGSIATVISLGTAALVWSYIPASKGSLPNDEAIAPEHGDKVE
ncbi:hypothetical protein M5689_006879 [Euphorbia peplus]|nr:hypothetical protein M5689_006879 [Euphorbia peplus]